MIGTYFLGANSHKGFASLYNGFCRNDGDALHIIKGGPGTGKSSFMRRIGEKAEELGFDVEYVLCSGDPDSLDGVYMPAMRVGFVDGTAPHTADPDVFGVTGDYINVGSFCRMPFSEKDIKRIKNINVRYKALYSRAYDYLEAAASVLSAASPEIMPADGKAAVKSRISEIISGIECEDKQINAVHRFGSAISCKGNVRTDIGERRWFIIKSSTGYQCKALEYVYSECVKRALPLIAYHSPLEPEKLEAVLLPTAGTGFAAECVGVDGEELINCDSFVPVSSLRASSEEIQAGLKLKFQLISLATEKLKEAKAFHDELEVIYKPYMDFKALTKFTDEYINKLFVDYIM